MSEKTFVAVDTKARSVPEILDVLNKYGKEGYAVVAYMPDQKAIIMQRIEDSEMVTIDGTVFVSVDDFNKGAVQQLKDAYRSLPYKDKEWE